MAAALRALFFNLSTWRKLRHRKQPLGNVRIMSTQSTLQAIYAARSAKACRKGFILGAFLLPVVGICCVVIGMYMRMTAPGYQRPSGTFRSFFSGTRTGCCRRSARDNACGGCQRRRIRHAGVAGYWSTTSTAHTPDASTKCSCCFRADHRHDVVLTTIIINSAPATPLCSIISSPWACAAPSCSAYVRRSFYAGKDIAPLCHRLDYYGTYIDTAGQIRPFTSV